MTFKIQRMEAAISGEVADRPPVALWRHFPVDDQDPISLADSTVAFQREFDFDFVKVTPASSFCLRDWGVEDEWRGNSEGTREYTHRSIRTSTDWVDVRPLNPDEGSLKDQIECLRKIRSELGPDVPILQTVFSPLAQAKNLAGQDALIEHIHRDPESVHLGLKVITQTTQAFVETLAEIGIDGIFFAVQHASYAYFDDHGYQQFGEIYDLEVLSAADRLWLNVLHLHGENLMFNIAQRYPVQVVSWDDRRTWPDLIEARKIVSVALCGGIHRKTLEIGTPEAVRREATESLVSMKEGAFVLSTGCVVPLLTPRVNLASARTAVDFV